jgi:hypothetical protein
MDGNASFYGTTTGTVFKLNATGTKSILHVFGETPTDGLSPFAGLAVDSAGNLYGTTVNGGANFGKTMNGELNAGGTVFVID